MKVEVNVEVKTRSLSVLVFLLGLVLAAHATETQPVSSAQLMAWLASGVPCNRLVRLVQERGIASFPDKEQFRQLQSAGADADLILALKRANGKPSPAVSSATEIPALLVQAATNARAQRFHEAELELRQALTSDPQNATLRFALGTMLRQQERWDDAFDEISIAAQLMPDFPENHSSLAYIFYRLDDGPNAIAEARTALSMDPQNAEAYQILGLGQYSNGQYGAAVHAFMESLARDPANPDTYYDLGITLHADGNQTAAIDAYRHAIRLHPAFWQAHSNLALILHEENKLDEALTEYREAKRLAPQEASVRNNLGNTYCDKGDFNAAMHELRELYREHPEWQQGHGCLARAYMSKKDYGSAVNEFQLAVRQNPNGAAEHRALGEALLLNDRLEEGVHELRQAVALNPDSDAAHHILGTALFQQQQLPAAEKEFREALRLNNSPDNHYSLAACLMSMHRDEEALSELDTAARLDPERKLYRARREELLKLMKQTNSQ
ncbi:MAG TPA: tetratricopeptide repeat protein [Candidatus Dormibacteraeota bacterium]|nr:tetratricopeptide repeat protein [Candidatus Dormibacteraeota bacterium]